MRSIIEGHGRKTLLYLIYLASFLAVLALTERGTDFVIAPPYAVSLYLVIFDTKSKYSAYSSLAFSYLLVIATTVLIHFFIGDTIYSMAVNVLIVSLAMTALDMIHPPSIALTIFSYLLKNIDAVAIYSVVVLLILLLLRYLLAKIPSHA